MLFDISIIKKLSGGEEYFLVTEMKRCSVLRRSEGGQSIKDPLELSEDI